MSDPYDIFVHDPSRQETLKILWPDLYECLARLDEPEEPRVLRCTLPAHPLGKGPAAVARVSDDYGPPACRPCLESVHGRGHDGWPLKRERRRAARR